MIDQSRLSDSTILDCARSILSQHLDYYDTNIENPWYTKSELIFDRFNATGNIMINSNSLTSMSLENGSMTILVENGTEYQLTNVDLANLMIVGKHFVSITTDMVENNDGHGFYSSLKLKNAKIECIVEPGSSVYFDNDMVIKSNCEINLSGNIQVLLRQPDFLIQGATHFSSLYSLHPSIIKVQGQNLTIDGELRFSIFASDTMNIILPYEIISNVQVIYDSHLINYEKTSPLPLIIAPFGLAITLLVRYSKSHRFRTSHLL